jgi:multicomponent Na+:H+ antiporter subunit C
MLFVLSFVIGILFAGATYFILRRSMTKLLLGLILLSNGVSLLIFLMGGLQSTSSPILSEQNQNDDPALLTPIDLDPLPQALIINVLLIGIAMMVAVFVLVYRTSQVIHSDDLDDLSTIETHE